MLDVSYINISFICLILTSLNINLRWTGVGTEEKVGKTNYQHRRGNLETYNEEPFVVGGGEPKTELMNSETFEWTMADDYPSNLVKLYSSISTETAVFIFAGNHLVQPPRDITKFENMRWTILGELLQPRNRPFIYRNENNFHVIGGYSANREL